MSSVRRVRAVCLGTLVLVVLLGLVVVLVVFGAFRHHTSESADEHCVAGTRGHSTRVDFAQAHHASVIAGIAVRRGLPVHAASIALTAASAESDIHNLDHGDVDSVGLFQQRPSQGWGSEKRLMDPYYATNQFYDHLVKIENWKSSKISKAAQRVQISKFPDAYPGHEETGRILASVLTGHRPAGIRCLISDQRPGDPHGLSRSLHKTYKIEPKRSGHKVVIKANSKRLAWSYAQYAIANARKYGLGSAQVGGHRWTVSKHRLAHWQRTKSSRGSRTVRLTMRS